MCGCGDSTHPGAAPGGFAQPLGVASVQSIQPAGVVSAPAQPAGVPWWLLVLVAFAVAAAGKGKK